MLLKRATNGLATNLPHDAFLHRVLGEKSDRPTGEPRRGSRARQRDQRALLPGIELLVGFRACIVREGMLQPGFQISPADTANLPRVAANGLSNLTQVTSLIEQFEDAHAPPRPRTRLLSALASKLFVIFAPQPQAGKSRRVCHPVV